MRLPRFTTRRLMVLVAVFAVVASFGIELKRRQTRFRALAKKHYDEAMQYFVLLPGPETEFQRKESQRFEEAFGAYVEYHGRLSQKYDHAADFPWLPVASDPLKPPKPKLTLEEWLGQWQAEPKRERVDSPSLGTKPRGTG